MRISQISNFFVMIILVSFSVAPRFVVLSDGKNALLIVLMLFSAASLLLNFTVINKIDIFLFLFIISIILFPLLNHPESIRWSTILYSVLFSLSFIAYKQFLYKSRFKLDNFEKILKYLIYSYFIVLLIQQFCVLFGLPILNVSNYDSNEPWKLNSLAIEPSHSARIVGLLMYCYIVVREIKLQRKYTLKNDFKNDFFIWLSFLWTMITMGSSTAYLFLIIILLSLLRLKNLLSFVSITGIIFLIIHFFAVESFSRFYKVVLSVVSFDIENIISTDHSASLRIVPIMIVASMVNITTLDGWFGHGVDYVSSFLYTLIPGIPEETTGGAMFQIWLEYGFISFLCFSLFSFFSIYNKKSFNSIIFWFFLIFMYGVNNQIVWLTLTFLYTIKKFNYQKA